MFHQKKMFYKKQCFLFISLPVCFMTLLTTVITSHFVPRHTTKKLKEETLTWILKNTWKKLSMNSHWLNCCILLHTYWPCGYHDRKVYKCQNKKTKAVIIAMIQIFGHTLHHSKLYWVKIKYSIIICPKVRAKIKQIQCE